GDEDSIGNSWTAVELERPNVKAATREGHASASLRRAIAQIHDWRSWLQVNLDYATRAREREGLGLTGIDPQLRGLIILGRRVDDDNPKFDRERRRLDFSDHIAVHS